MIKPKKPSPTESPLLFEIAPEPLAETLTAWGGVPLAVQAFRSLGIPASVQRHVHVKQRERGFDEATMVESFVVLNTLGGECLDDFQHLREDGGLAEMLGHEIPSPEAARQFLNRFHAEERMEEAKQDGENDSCKILTDAHFRETVYTSCEATTRRSDSMRRPLGLKVRWLKGSKYLCSLMKVHLPSPFLKYPEGTSERLNCR